MRERRAAHRYKLVLPIVVRRTPTLTEADLFYGRTHDISTSGLYFTTNRRLALEEEFDFSLAFPGESAQGVEVFVVGQAKVRRVEEKPEAAPEPVGVAAAIQKFHIVRS
jgi:hypothetical protein